MHKAPFFFMVNYTTLLAEGSLRKHTRTTRMKDTPSYKNSMLKKITARADNTNILVLCTLLQLLVGQWLQRSQPLVVSCLLYLMPQHQPLP